MNLDLRSFLRIMGLVLVVIGFAMLPSFVVSLVCDGASVYKPFLITLSASIAAGVFLLKFLKPTPRTLRVRDGFFIVTMCWLMSAIVGSIPFIVTSSITNPLDAFFESCSGFSTTGASILTDVESLPRGILFWRSFTHWIGGMGILIFAIALMPSLGISGQNVAVSEGTGPTLDKPASHMSQTAKGLYIIYILFTLLETVLLMFGGMSLYDALVHTFGTVGTGGFSSYNDGIAHFDSAYIDVVITFFMVLCGVNFNLYYFAFRSGLSHLYKDSEFKSYLLIFGISAVLIIPMLLFMGDYNSPGEAVMDSTFQTASILTTTGYTTADYEMWPTACQTILFLLMFIGGCSASTSGGLKVIRALVLFKLVKRGIALRLHPNVVETVKVDGQAIPGETVSSIANHFFLYLLLIFAGAFLISFENEDMMTCFSSVISCLGNIGPGFGSIGYACDYTHLSMFSKGVLSICMLAGRLELYTLFILLTPRFWNQNH